MPTEIFTVSQAIAKWKKKNEGLVHNLGKLGSIKIIIPTITSPLSTLSKVNFEKGDFQNKTQYFYMTYGLATTAQKKKNLKTATKAQLKSLHYSPITMTSFYYLTHGTVIIFKISMQFRFIKL